MEQIEGEANLPNRNPIAKIDRRNNAILTAVGIPMLISSLFSLLSGTNLLPAMWLELFIIITLGLLYNWSVRHQRADVRLGVVYIAVGIGLSFTLLSIGLIVSTLLVVNLPFLMGSDFESALLLPFFLSGFILYILVHRISRKVAMKQRRDMNKELRSHDYKSLDTDALYLVEKKWCGFWLYLFLFMNVELVPLILKDTGPSNWLNVAVLIAIFLILLVSSYSTLRGSKNVFIFRK